MNFNAIFSILNITENKLFAFLKIPNNLDFYIVIEKVFIFFLCKNSKK